MGFSLPVNYTSEENRSSAGSLDTQSVQARTDTSLSFEPITEVAHSKTHFSTRRDGGDELPLSLPGR
jgi:hypothetical protein